MTPPDGCSGPAPDGPDQRRLLLVAPSPRLVQEAVSAGYAVWTLSDSREPADRDPGPSGPDGASGCTDAGTDGLTGQVGPPGPSPGPSPGRAPVPLRADFGDARGLCELVTETAREHRIGRLLPFGEASGLPALLETAERLELSPNPAESVRLLGDPSAMRDLLNGSGHSYVTSARVGSFGELPAAVERVGMPAMVRPLRAGAAGPRPALVRERADIDGGRVREQLAGHPGPYLVETFLDGPEYGVETLTVDGMHRVLGITALHRAGAAGPDHLFPAPLAARDEAEIRAATTGLLGLAGYEFGFAYTVAVLTAQGPRVVRSQARQADEPVGRLIELATGLAPEAELLRALSGAPVEPPVARRYASAVPFRLPPGQELPAHRLKEIAGLPGVRDVWPPHPPGDGEGYVVLVAGSPDEASLRVVSALRLLGADADAG